ncbi:unnamed protein product [Microthlaspi erraticum]|uniref:Uncharacterized protein n=1 Tax=Microthlaspi erraticum TaxID=1685480 RepID=A0A6D2JHE5_9BRAS|nr:unnamed protein product [Microthlaspi erraticum]
MLEKEDDDCEEGDEGGIPESEGVRERETGQETEGGVGKEMKGVQVSKEQKARRKELKGASMVEREEEKITSYDKTGEEDSEGGIGDGNAKEVHVRPILNQIRRCQPRNSGRSDVGAVGEYTEAEKLPEKVTENVEDEGDEAMKTPEKEKADVD